MKYWGAIECTVPRKTIYRYYFIQEADSVEQFKWIMRETLRIPDSFMERLVVGTEWNDETPLFIKDNWHFMQRGEMSYFIKYQV